MRTNDKNGIDVNELYSDIKTKALDKLDEDLKKINIASVEINNLKYKLYKIKKESNYQNKIKLFMLFLMQNSKHYNSSKNTPLNTFSFNCTVILKKHFIL